MKAATSRHSIKGMPIVAVQEVWVAIKWIRVLESKSSNIFFIFVADVPDK